MLIGVDLDDVLADFTGAFDQFHNSAYGTALKREDRTSYDTWQIVGGSREDDEQKLADFYKTEFFKNIGPLPGAVSAVNALSDGNDLIIITARVDGVARDTKIWLEKHFPSKFKETYFSRYYDSLDMSKKKKSEIALGSGIDLFIEDNLGHAADCTESGIRVFLFDQPWNQSLKLPRGILRVYSWTDILMRMRAMDIL